jgi:hypothetical protein
MSKEVYRHVPDLSWVGWQAVALPLYSWLRRPATTEEVVEWGQGPGLDVDGGRARRTLYVRNVLAWLSLQGKVDYVGGRWRRVAT